MVLIFRFFILSFPLAFSFFIFPGFSWALPRLVLEPKTGTVLHHSDAFHRWYPASLTKLMTAYVTFRAVAAREISLDFPVVVSSYAARQKPSKMGCRAGSALTLGHALKMILVHSSNDIAVAISENVASSEKAFVARMNREAQRLGMQGTHYTNPSGLFSLNQFTTAHDQALLVMAIRNEFPQYLGYFSIRGVSHNGKKMNNSNILLGRYPGADGMKTGFICESGFNLVASATRGDRSLVAIVMGASSDLERALVVASLLNQGFSGKPGHGKPLWALKPYGKNMDLALNLRSKICENPNREFLYKGRKIKSVNEILPKPLEEDIDYFSIVLLEGSFSSPRVQEKKSPPLAQRKPRGNMLPIPFFGPSLP